MTLVELVDLGRVRRNGTVGGDPAEQHVVVLVFHPAGVRVAGAVCVDAERRQRYVYNGQFFAQSPGGRVDDGFAGRVRGRPEPVALVPRAQCRHRDAQLAGHLSGRAAVTGHRAATRVPR